MPERLKDVLFETLDKLDLRQRVEEGFVFCHWDEIVGCDVARRAQPRAVKSGILFVDTVSGVWAQELGLLKQQILTNLNRGQKRKIKDIRFRSAKADGEIQDGENRGEEQPLDSVDIAEDDRQRIDSVAGRVESGPLRKKLADIMVLDHKLKILKNWSKGGK